MPICKFCFNCPDICSVKACPILNINCTLSGLSNQTITYWFLFCFQVLQATCLLVYYLEASPTFLIVCQDVQSYFMHWLFGIDSPSLHVEINIKAWKCIQMLLFSSLAFCNPTPCSGMYIPCWIYRHLLLRDGGFLRISWTLSMCKYTIFVFLSRYDENFQIIVVMPLLPCFPGKFAFA